MAGRTVSPVFVGRSDELGRLTAAHQHAADRRAASVIVSGEAGIGKSRLVAELLKEAAHSGSVTLVGRCAPYGDASIPYAPFLEALRGIAPQSSRLDVLRLLAPALDEPSYAGVADERSLADPSGKVAAFAAILDLLERTVVETTTVLLVEDIHWASPSTIDLLMHIAGNAPAGLLLVTTVRQPVRGAEEAAIRFVPELLRHEGAELIELGPLGRAEVANLLGEIVEGPPRAELLDGIAMRSGGNPLFVEELCAAALRGELGTVPAELRELVLARTKGMRREARLLLESASASGDIVDVQTIATASAVAPADQSRAVSDLVGRGILVVDPTEGSRVQFRHSVVREVVYAQLDDAERRAIHRRLAAALTRGWRRERRPGQSAAVARHWLASGNGLRAVPFLLASAQEAVRAFAHDEASASLRRAIDVLEASGSRSAMEPSRLHIYLRAADAAATAGDAGEAQRILERAEALPLNRDQRFVVRERRAAWSWHTGDERRAYSIWAELVEGRRPSRGSSADALQALARALMYLARFEEAAPIAEAAVARARSEGRGELECDGLITLGMALIQSDRIDEGLDALRRAGRRATELRSVRHLRPAYSLLSGMSAEAERFDEAIAAGREYLETARRLEVPASLRYMGIENYVYTLQLVGRWDEAASMFDEALAAQLPNRTVAGLLVGRAALRCQRGDFTGAIGDLEEISTLAPGMAQHSMVGALHAIRAEVAIWEGERDAARLEVDAGIATASDVVQAQEDMFHELVMLGMRVEADAGLREHSSRSSMHSDEPMRRAARLLLGLRQRRRRRKPSYTLYAGLIAGTVLQSRAEARRLKARPAVTLWRRAADRWATLHRPYLEAYARLRLAESLAAEGAASPDVTRELGRSLGIATRLGALPLRREIEVAARRSGLELDALSAWSGATVGSSLTPRERQVLRLLASGQSNREIGNELGIAEKTAEIHVSNVLRKLGVERRLEAAMLAVQLGIVPIGSGVVTEVDGLPADGRRHTPPVTPGRWPERGVDDP